jgi:hypothetical protein
MKMTLRTCASLCVLLAFCTGIASSQQAADVYTANAIASEAVPGAIYGRIVIRVASYTTPGEKASLVEALKKSSEDGVAAMLPMSTGYLNVEGQDGRKIHAAFQRDRSDGTHEIILVCEHKASRLEQWRGTKPADHPLAVIQLRFGSDGKATYGEIFPAVKLTITPEGFPDVKTDTSNQVKLYEIAKR